MKISKRPRAFHAAAAVFGHAYQPVAGADGLVLSVAAAVATQPTNQRPSSLGGANQLPGKGRECEAASACLPAFGYARFVVPAQTVQFQAFIRSER